MKPFLTGASALILIFAANFSSADELVPALMAEGQFSRPMPKAAVAPLALGKETGTLVASKRGFLLLDKKGTQLAQAAPSAELLDLRDAIKVMVDGNTKILSLAASVALPEQQPVIMAVDTSEPSIRELARLPVPDFKIVNLCLSRDSTGLLSLFVLDGRGSAQHWLLLDAEGHTRIRHLRNLAVPPDAKSCYVDDTQEKLFIAEEGVGLWTYDAAVESDGNRHALDMAAPFGHMQTAAESIAAGPGVLLALLPGSKQLQVYATEAGNNILRTISLAALVKPDVVSARWNSDKSQMELLIYDDKTARVYQQSFSWKASPAAVNPVAVALVKPEAQTQVMARFGDAADDPAIWVNAADPQASRVIGTNKQQGLFVYDLQGRELQHFDTGRLNNVDVRRGVKFGGLQVDLVVATNRDDDSLALFTVSSSGELSPAGRIATGLSDIYGICLYQSPANVLYAFPNSKSGAFEQIRITADYTNNQWRWRGEKVREFSVASQPEGCVADDARQRLFFGEEDVGIWTLGAEPDAGTKPQSIAKVGGSLVADVEGVGLYLGKHHSYLVVSSQGNNSYVIYDAVAPYQERGVVRIQLDAEKNIDGSSETDGLDVTSLNLGGAFSEGMLVVQDGHKVMPAAPQNFKYVSWEKIRKSLRLPR